MIRFGPEFLLQWHFRHVRPRCVPEKVETVGREINFRHPDLWGKRMT